MNQFQLYFTIGWQHIANWQAIDHWLFLAALCLKYPLSEWKKMLVLITAFTSGHSITLALSTLQLLVISTNWIEFLIPCTILFTAIGNLWAPAVSYKSSKRNSGRFWYAAALVFGCVHGLGFSNYLKSMLGKEQQIFVELLSFNLGIEIAQIALLALFSLMQYYMAKYINLKSRDVKLVLGGAIAALAIQMMATRWPL